MSLRSASFAVARATLALAAELLAPTTCAACDGGLESAALFCPTCALSLERARGPARTGVLAPLVYGGAAAQALARFKYRARPDLGPRLGRVLGEWLRARALDVDLVVPVPMHDHRLATRGYDHAALLAGAAARALGVPLAPRCLARRRDTPAQVGLPRAARLVNLAGAVVCVAPGRVRGRRVLVVDDVVTTGATLAACTLALAEGAADRVVSAAFAIRDDEPDPPPLSSRQGR